MSNAARILLALVLGLVGGIAWSELAPGSAAAAANVADPIGALWLNGLRMTVVPLVVALLVTGIAQSAEAARAGKVAGRTIGFILTAMFLSAVAGAILMPLYLQIFPIPAQSAAALRSALVGEATIGAVPSVAESIRALVPTNPIAAAANDAILPLIVFTAVFAFAVTRLEPEPRGRLTRGFAALADTMIVIVRWVLVLAPIGVFALAFVVGARAGANAFGALFHYIALVSAVGIVLGLLAYPIAALFGRVPLGGFAQTAAPVQALAVSTQSSLACLPLMLEKSAALGVRPATAGVVLPLAVAMFRVTGPAMNLAVALYVANWFGVTLGPVQIAVAVLAATLGSLGAVNLPGTVSFISSTAPICLAVGIPVEPLALLIAVETIPDIFRTAGNVTMDLALTATVARSADTGDEA